MGSTNCTVRTSASLWAIFERDLDLFRRKDRTDICKRLLLAGSNDKVDKQLAQKPHRIVRLEDTDGDGGFDKSVVFADQMINGSMYETDEHPPADIRAGQYTTAQVITALRTSPSTPGGAML